MQVAQPNVTIQYPPNGDQIEQSSGSGTVEVSRFSASSLAAAAPFSLTRLSQQQAAGQSILTSQPLPRSPSPLFPLASHSSKQQASSSSRRSLSSRAVKPQRSSCCHEPSPLERFPHQIFFFSFIDLQGYTVTVAMEGTSNTRTDSLIWTDAQLEFLINLLVQQSRLPGMKSGANLKPKAYKAIEQKMIEQFGPGFTVEKIKNKLKITKADYNMCKQILATSGFGWDPTNKCVVVENEVWAEYIKEKNLVEDGRAISIEEQVAIFLLTVGHNERNRACQNTFQHSGQTISKYVNLILRALCQLGREYISRPNDDIPSKIRFNPRFYPYFKDDLVAIAALQSFLVPVAFMSAVLHLLKVPYNAEFANSSNKVPLLLAALCDLQK
ncbi:hypothetical protein EJ110_NYTH17399 [Nymphaea thermarum]|nr:hypothetical protein EJ110_NYTH17399 [Nymphaea thermarum]